MKNGNFCEKILKISKKSMQWRNQRIVWNFQMSSIIVDFWRRLRAGLSNIPYFCDKFYRSSKYTAHWIAVFEWFFFSFSHIWDDPWLHDSKRKCVLSLYAWLNQFIEHRFFIHWLQLFAEDFSSSSRYALLQLVRYVSIHFHFFFFFLFRAPWYGT